MYLIEDDTFCFLGSPVGNWVFGKIIDHLVIPSAYFFLAREEILPSNSKLQCNWGKK